MINIELVYNTLSINYNVLALRELKKLEIIKHHNYKMFAI